MQVLYAPFSHFVKGIECLRQIYEHLGYLKIISLYSDDDSTKYQNL